MKHYNFIYKTSFNDGRYYIGQHKTDKLDDHYFGSSEIVKDLVKNHPELEPKREILRYCDTQDDLNYWEKYFIGDNWKDDPLCLNANNTCTVVEMTEEKRKKHSISNKGKQRDRITSKTLKLISLAHIGNTNTKEHIWLSNGIDTVYPHKDNANYYLELGYHFGRK